MPSGRAAEPAEAQAVLTELVSVRHATLPQREAGWMLAAGCGEFLVRSASAWLCAQAWGGKPSWHLEDDADLPCPIARDQWNPVPVGPLFWFTVKLSCKTVSTKKSRSLSSNSLREFYSSFLRFLTSCCHRAAATITEVLPAEATSAAQRGGTPLLKGLGNRQLDNRATENLRYVLPACNWCSNLSPKKGLLKAINMTH